jgi:hypothetical protein
MKPLKVLIACEESQAYTQIFRALGHEAYSCDLQECGGDLPQYHLEECAIHCAYSYEWDLMIAHPPCTKISFVGQGWLSHPADKEKDFTERRPHPKHPNRREEFVKALDFVNGLASAPIPYIAIENPLGFLSTEIGRAFVPHTWFENHHIYQPYQFGDFRTKRTCYWFKNLQAPKRIYKRDELSYKQRGLDSDGRNVWFEKASSKIRSKTTKKLALNFALSFIEQIERQSESEN